MTTERVSRGVHAVILITCITLLSGTLTPAHAEAPPLVRTDAASDVALQARQSHLHSEQRKLDLAHVSASQRAVAQSAAVVVDELTTPTEQVLALPDGSFEYQASSVPVRVQQAEEWVPIDTTLIERDGWLQPRASATPVRFSTGGSGVVDQVQTGGGQWVTETWPAGNLPTPVVEGSTATYRDVLPDVDLKLTATDLGMATVYVVKTAAAVADGELDQLHVVATDATLHATPAGVVEITADGAVSRDQALVASSPLWWDSSEGGTFIEPGGDLPPQPIDHLVTQDSIRLDVPGTVEDKDVQYPIFVDPDWASGENASWYTDAAYPNQSYLSAGASDRLRVGVSRPYFSDMFFQFYIAPLAGKQILSATLDTWQIAALSCPSSPISMFAYGPQSPGFTWNQSTTWGSGQWGPWMQTASPGDCNSPPMAVAWNATAGVQAKLGQQNIQIAFTFADANSDSSRRHYSRAATLRVVYNTPPNLPTNLTIVSPPRGCSTNPAAPEYVGTSDVTVSVHQTDPDGENVDTNFELFRTTDLVNRIQWRWLGLIAQGTRQATFNAIPDGSYAWRAQGSDWKIGGPTTGFCYFTVDTVAPPPPTVSLGTTTLRVGEPVTATLSGANDVAGYSYWISDGKVSNLPPPVPVAGKATTDGPLPACGQIRSAGLRTVCGLGSTGVPVSVAPSSQYSTLWVAAYDKAGNNSTAVGTPLYGGTSTPAGLNSQFGTTGHSWILSNLSSPLGNVIEDSNTALAPTARISIELPPGAPLNATSVVRPPYSSPVLQSAELPNPGDAISTSSAPFDASQSFTVSVWIQPDALPSTSQYVWLQAGAGPAIVSLKYRPDGTLSFCIEGSASSGNSALVSGCATGGTASPGQWTLVTGVWDNVNQQLRLNTGASMNPVAVTPHLVGAGDWSANGPLLFAPYTGTRFTGLISNPVAAPGVISGSELALQAQLIAPF